MTDFELRKNAEGYADPTAHDAITGMIKAGEIWTYRDKEALVIKSHGRFCSVLVLTDNEREGGIEIISRAKKYTNPAMISYAFNDQLSMFVRALSDDEFDDVLGAVEDALAINIPRKLAVGANNAAEKELYALRVELSEASSRNQVFSAELKAANNTVTALKAKIDLLKEMYADLVAKVV